MEESERIEEYLEILYRMELNGEKATTVNIAKKLHVAPSSVTEMIQKLAEKGYLVYNLYRGVELTEQGREIGKKILGRHRLIEEFLKFINVDERRIHDLACKMEHVIDDDVFNGISNLLYKFRENGNLKLLSELSEGDSGYVVTVHADDRNVKNLMNIGFAIKASVKVKRSLIKSGTMIVSVNGNDIAIDEEMAKFIVVRKE
jgi:DtxR family Mn-dependent transcriptional regulator